MAQLVSRLEQHKSATNEVAESSNPAHSAVSPDEQEVVFQYPAEIHGLHHSASEILLSMV